MTDLTSSLVSVSNKKCAWSTLVETKSFYVLGNRMLLTQTGVHALVSIQIFTHTMTVREQNSLWMAKYAAHFKREK